MKNDTINYINLSALASGNFFDEARGAEIGSIIDNGKVADLKLDLPELSALLNPSNPLRSYILIASANNPTTGFAAAAFKNPDTGEIVFSFRGTNPDEPSEFYKDITNADEQIFTGLTKTLPAQFADAESFVNKVLSENPTASNCTFTVHSLGGALAQYMTYKTNHNSFTFNAPGVGMIIESVVGKNINFSDYKDKSTNYANESDIVGNYRNYNRIGKNVLVQSNLNNKTGSDVRVARVLRMQNA